MFSWHFSRHLVKIFAVTSLYVLGGEGSLLARLLHFNKLMWKYSSRLRSESSIKITLGKEDHSQSHKADLGPLCKGPHTISFLQVDYTYDTADQLTMAQFCLVFLSRCVKKIHFKKLCSQFISRKIWHTRGSLAYFFSGAF